MHITLGSNIYHDTNGVINAESQELIRLEVGNDGTLYVTLPCYDARGQRVAQLRHNVWVQNDGAAFDLVPVPDGVRIVRPASGEVVLDARATDLDSVEIAEGSLYTHTGRLLQILSDHWRIGTDTMGGFVFNCQGAAVSIA